MITDARIAKISEKALPFEVVDGRNKMLHRKINQKH